MEQYRMTEAGCTFFLKFMIQSLPRGNMIGIMNGAEMINQ
jgi:hypothetical protein